jgi:hypothetical protein
MTSMSFSAPVDDLRREARWAFIVEVERDERETAALLRVEEVELIE